MKNHFRNLFLIFAITNCSLKLNNFNEIGKSSYFQMQTLFCLTGLDSVFCPKIPVSGVITAKGTKTPIGQATVAFSPGVTSSLASSVTDSSGNFSGNIGFINFNATVKSSNKVTLGTFSGSIENDQSIKISNVSSGMTVSANRSQAGVTFNINVDESSFFSFMGSTTGIDTPYKVIQSVDGGYIITGAADVNIPSIGAVTPIISNTTLTNDCLIAKFNSSGVIQWYTFFGGAGNDNCFGISQTADEGYIISGTAATAFTTLGGLTPKNPHSGTSSLDGVVMKISSSGKLEWFTFIGCGTTYATFPSVALQTNDDSGYIIAGMSNSSISTFSGVTPLNSHNGAGQFDQFILKLSKNGSLSWITYLGGSGTDNIAAISQTTDSGFVSIGESGSSITSINGILPKISYTGSPNDQFITKIDKNGNLKWFTFFGSAGNESGNSVYATSDGGTIVGGKILNSISTLGGKSPLSTHSGNASGDCLVAKINSSGDLDWFTFIGPTTVTTGCITVETPDNDYLLLGTVSASINTLGGVQSQYNFAGGTSDFLLVKLKANGSIKWYDMIGSSSGADTGRSISNTSDGGFIFTGNIDSAISGNSVITPIIPYSGSTDIIFFKLKGDGKY